MGLQIKDLEVGGLLSEQQFYKVIGKSESSVKVKNSRGVVMNITNNIVQEGMFSSDQYTSTVEVTRTELVKHFREVGDNVFTVKYRKALDPKVIQAAIADPAVTKLSLADTKRLLKGEIRELRGHLVHTEQVFGHVNVVDLDIALEDPKAHAFRKVAENTLVSLVCKNVMYIIKGEQ